MLLEAGPPDRKREIAIPIAFPPLFESEVDWRYWTEPEPELAQPYAGVQDVGPE